MYHVSIVKWHRWLKSLLIENKDLFILYTQFHGSWWPGNARSQGINIYEIALDLTITASTPGSWFKINTSLRNVDHHCYALTHCYEFMTHRCQVGIKPSATTMLTWLWFSLNLSGCAVSEYYIQLLSIYIFCNCHLTLNVRGGPSYLGLIRSISWLLMPWLLTSPGHQQPWYWLYKRSFSYLRKDFKYLCHINVDEGHKM